ncbi:MAG: succinic semialdehyde dehydrogenase [Candidatus Nanopelagicales bacterium]
MSAEAVLARARFNSELAEDLLSVATARVGAERHTTLAPFDGRPLMEIPCSTAADVDVAFHTASGAQERWAATPIQERKRAMLRFHDLLIRRRDEGLDLIQWETGKPRMDALKELLGVCAIARHYARESERLLAAKSHWGVLPGLTSVRVEHQPVGVVGVLAPWNLPLFSCADAIPALMAGNAVVLEPDQQTSLTALWAVDLMRRAGIPPRALQVVLGERGRLGPEITERADHVVFTGSTAEGSRIAAQCGERLVGCSMELGGKNPMIVCADADPVRASQVALRACFDNAGQLSFGIERILLVGGANDAFLEQLVARLSGLRMRAEVGWGSDYGSLIGAEQLERVSSVVGDAVGKGASVVTGGRALAEIGPYYYAPTLLAGVTEGMAAYRDETLGPVVAVTQVADEEEAVAMAGDSPYGLNAVVLAGDPQRGVAIARRIKVGTVNVNEAYEAAIGSPRAPTGGMRVSGMGRRNGEQGLTRFTEEQTIAVQRGIGLGTPLGMLPEDWGSLMVRVFSVMKRMGLK